MFFVQIVISSYETFTWNKYRVYLWYRSSWFKYLLIRRRSWIKRIKRRAYDVGDDIERVRNTFERKGRIYANYAVGLEG